MAGVRHVQPRLPASYDYWKDVRKLAVAALAMRRIAKVKKPVA